MMLGKVFMLMMARQKQKGGQNQKLKYWKQFQADTIKNLNKASFIAYERYPIALWFLGFLFTIVGIIITGLVMLHRHVFLDDLDGLTYFTKMMISLSTFLSGFIMLVVAKKEKLRINKNEDLIYVEYKNIFCRGHLEGRYLHSLQDFNIVKKGIETFTENTIHYVIRFEFNEDFEDLEVAECRKFVDIKKKYIQICTYLDKDVYSQIDSIKFIDESTVTLKWKQKKNEKKATKKPTQLQSNISKNGTSSSTSLSLQTEPSLKQPVTKTSSFLNSFKITKKFKVNDD